MRAGGRKEALIPAKKGRVTKERRRPGERRDPAPLQAIGKSLDSGFRRNDEKKKKEVRDEGGGGGGGGGNEVVSPANAGIQRLCGVSKNWIPAFAGMTGKKGTKDAMKEVVIPANPGIQRLCRP